MNDDATNKEWQIFYDKVVSYASDPPAKWTSLTLLSYFIQKYKEVNNIDYIFTPSKRGPTHTKEMKDAAKIFSTFDKHRLANIANKEEKIEYKKQLVMVLKQYIDWAFGIKMRGKTTNITGLGLFTNANFMNEFLQWRNKNAKILPSRSTPLPIKYIEWINQTIPEILKKQQLAVLQDLNALLDYVAAYDANNSSIEYKALVRARDLGIMPTQGKLELDKK